MSKKTAVIMGVTGQDGAYLACLLLQKKYRVIGVATHVDYEHCQRLRALGLEKKLLLIPGDASDSLFLKHVLLQFQPTEWYNLAAISSVARSWEIPEETLDLNGVAVMSMLEAIRMHRPKTRFFQASSAEIFGNASGVITEQTDCFAPINPYGVGKLTAHFAIRSMRDRYGLFAVNGILFNHESPLRPDVFVSKKIAQGVARIARNLDTHIELGNLDVVRNWTFAGDIVRAMWLMLQAPTPSDLIICSHENHSIADFVQASFAHVGIRQWKKYVRVNPQFVRKNDVRRMRGSARRAQELLDWKASVDFRSLVAMMVDYELERCSDT